VNIREDSLPDAGSATFDGSGISVARVAALARGPVRADYSLESWRRIRAARYLVERRLAAGAVIYGTTTGVGSQKDVAVESADLAAFSDRMIISEATDFPGPAYSDTAVRAALVVLINNVAAGRTGVRPELAQRLLDLLAAPRMPLVRRDASNGVADLTPLSQLSLALLGLSLDGSPPILPQRFTLAPKESVSLIDNNSFALGSGALVLAEIEALLRTFDLAAATALEGLRGGVLAHLSPAAGGARSPGQDRAREQLLAALQGSALHAPGTARFLQDPMSFRSITQIHGAAYETWNWAKRQFETEINASADNPLVDVASAALYPSSSMVCLLPVLSLDCLRQALAKLAQQSTERALKLQSPPFSGLAVGLAEDGAADGGILSINLNYIGSARLGSLLASAAPVLLHYVGTTSDGVEDLTSLLPLSVSQTESLVERAWEIAALEMSIAVWALARRRVPVHELGLGPRAVYDALLPLLPIGSEGRRIFRMQEIVARIRSGDLLADRVRSPRGENDVPA
jgi:histidine ammonia-lyase